MSDEEKTECKKITSNEEVIDELTKEFVHLAHSKTEELDKTEDTVESQSELEHEESTDDVETCIEGEKLHFPFDDYIDEQELKIVEEVLSEEEKDKRREESEKIKQTGNEEFKAGKYWESINSYTTALKLCPLSCKTQRAILYSNRAASKIKLDHKDSALEDCTKAIELNSSYVKALLRRAKIYESLEKLDEALEDYKKVENLDSSDMEVKHNIYVLSQKIEKRNEDLKTEMLSKLKDLGNLVLKPFGLSTDNFQLNKNEDSEGYSVNFVQNKK